MNATENLLARLRLVNGKDDCNCHVSGNSNDVPEHDQYCAYRMCCEAADEIDALVARAQLSLKPSEG